MSDVRVLAPTAAELLKQMAGRRVLVVGDAMLDEWIWGSVTRVSPEAPVPVVAVRDHSFTLGGAANVANNLRALDARVTFIGVVGDDPEGERVRRLFVEKSIDTPGLLTVRDRPTTRKTRIVAHNQQVVRADWESAMELDPVDRERVRAAVARAVEGCDAVVLSDYNKGLFSREIVEAALGARIVVADPKPGNIDLFADVTCVAPNAGETSSATGTQIVDDASLERAGTDLLERLRSRYVIITRGEAGMALFGRDGERAKVPSVARTVYDVSGAGDTVVAVLTLALAAGASMSVSMQLANYAAGAVVEKLGTATASAAEIVALVSHDA
ncbi:MAG TPA: D-glycero-beta-D-manno-heptose-7-phosphate kinase [Candidatus Binatia bacterium]|nr:D-glycero-beta-D-manno-heptose-7-phosphate kinase [Candidatus Binatia bacterium]